MAWKGCLTVVIVAIMLAAPLTSASVQLGNPFSPKAPAPDPHIKTMTAPAIRSFTELSGPRATGNKTEHMGHAKVAPDIEGNLTPGEWDDAATYQIGTNGQDVRMYIMFNDTRIFIAFDVVSDVTNDTQDPGGLQLVNPHGDFFLMAIDGEDDGKLTYGSIDSGGNDWPSTMPITEGGFCVDRWAICHGGKARMAGFVEVNKAKTGPMFYYWTGPGPNNNQSVEPTDWLNTSFKTHRTFEYSIPYTGLGDELNRSFGKKIGLVAVVNDGSTQTVIGRMPWNASTNGIGPPWQEFMINGKPHVKMAPPSKTVILAGDSIQFADGGSTEPDGEALDHAWDFDFDGTTFTNDTQGASTTHKFDVAGNFTVALRVMDPHGAHDTAITHITVIQKEFPPVISDPDPTQVYPIIEGQMVIFTANFSDPNFQQGGEKLHCVWTIDGTQVKAFDSTANGITSLALGTNYTGTFSAGTYKIKLKVDDSYNAQGFYTGGSQSVSFEWTLTVVNKNRPPQIIGYLPANVDQVMTNEVTKVSFNITKFDPDGDAMTVAWFLDGVLQAGATADSYDYLATADYKAAGDHKVKVTVKDLGTPPYQIEMAWNITVLNITRPPNITLTNPTAGLYTIDEGAVQKFEIGAKDPDGDIVTYQWWYQGEIVDGETGSTYFFQPDYNMSSQTAYEIQVVISDGNITLPVTWDVLVKDVDRPFVASIRDPKAGNNYPLSSIVTFDASLSYDPDNDPLTFLWNFGDGTTKTVARTTHKYATPGNFEVSLSMTSTHGTTVVKKTYYINITIDAAIVNLVHVRPNVDHINADGTVNIEVTVTNNGTIRADDLIVELTLDNGAAIGSYTKQSIEPGAAKSFPFTWKATSSGKHSFNAKVKPGQSADTVVVKSQMTSSTVNVKATGLGHVSNNMAYVLVAVLVIVIVMVLLIIVLMKQKPKDRFAHIEQSKAEPSKAYTAVEQRPVQVQPRPEPVRAPPPPPPPPPPPQVKAKTKADEMSDDEAARLEAEFEAEEARAAEAKAKAKARSPPPPPPQLPKAMPAKPPPPPPKVQPKLPPPPPPKVEAPKAPPEPEKPAEPEYELVSHEKDVEIKLDKSSSSIAGDGLAVTGEMAQMAADAGLCPGCGGTVSSEDTHCPVCMQKLAVPKWLQDKRKEEADAKKKAEAKPGKCPKCGDDVEPDFARCPSCGAKLK